MEPRSELDLMARLNRWNILNLFAWCLSASAGTLGCAATSRASSSPPNIVIIFADDLGWGDLGSFGAKRIRTPNLDKLARQGTRYTSFYVSQPVCSASRASLLTGCYANRIGIHGALSPHSKTGLNERETTLAEMLRNRGYSTAIYGKWHLGDAPQFLPQNHGFDEYMGLPYSNDMWPIHPTAKQGTYPPLPLIEGTNVVELMPDQTQLTKRYTERAVEFIRENRAKPFFLYLAHSMPHAPLHASAKFKGRSRQGLYGDVIEEIDWSVGEVLRTLDQLQLARNTWVIFTSDNGPWHSYGDHAGSAGPFREGKGSVFEGGVRVPCVMRWPGRIPSGRVSKEAAMTLDLFPTIASKVGGTLPTLPIDGLDIWPLLAGVKGAHNPHSAYAFYYNHGELQAIRSGAWKLLLPHRARGMQGQPGGQGGTPKSYSQIDVGLELYNLERDPGEKLNIASRHPGRVQQLSLLVEQFRADLGDSLTHRTGSGLRPPGRLEPSEPR